MDLCSFNVLWQNPENVLAGMSPESLQGNMSISPRTNLINHAKICSVYQKSGIWLKIFENGCRIIAHLYWQRLV